MSEDSRKQAVEERRRFWQDHLSRWQQSGLSRARYCRDNQLSYHRLIYWSKRFSACRESVSFVAVPFSPEIHPSFTTPLWLHLQNGYRIEVGRGFDPHTLVQLLGVVREL